MHGEQKAPVEDRGRGPRRRSGRAHPTKKVKGPKKHQALPKIGQRPSIHFSVADCPWLLIPPLMSSDQTICQ